MSEKNTLPIPKFLAILFAKLRYIHQFPLDLADYEALWYALQAGFGLASLEKLRDLCVALWAKSYQEQQVVEDLFQQLFERNKWFDEEQRTDVYEENSTRDKELVIGELELPSSSSSPVPPVRGGIPPLILPEDELRKYPFILTSQFPLTYRQVVQAWRRLRRPVRTGPPTELDVDATVVRRCRLGVVTEPVLQPRRRNTARLLLLVDRQGSMNPFHNFVDEVCRAIQQAGRLEKVGLYYFHDTPAEGADRSILTNLPTQLFPSFDSVLSKIHPLTEGDIFEDADLLLPQTVADVLENYARGAAVVVISDAGAVRQRYDTLRLLNTIAFLIGLRQYTRQIVWLNPLGPIERWRGNTAGQIARYIPMFLLDQQGIYQAINVLRGQPYPLESSL